MTLDWHKSFVGRDTDLKVLQDAWDEARKGTPRVVAIVAESGFGKTRLAQEFYNWLSTAHDGVGGTGYWPDRLLREADNLRVNPDPSSCGGDEGTADMPFLWWGLRLPDPGQRNVAAVRSAFAAGLDWLRPHLARLEREVERTALKQRQITGGGKTAGDVALSVAETAFDAFSGFATLGLGGIAKTVGKAGWEHRKASQDLHALDGLDVGPAAAEGRALDKLAETALGDLFRVCKSPPGGLEAIPLVILVDDIQWLDADGGTASFLDLLLARARAEGWPLLLVLTSWRQEWRSTSSAGRVPGTLADVDGGDIVHDLSGVQGLESIVRKAFPGLTAEQVDALAEKAEGTPRLLDEMLMYLARRTKAFERRDRGAALTDAGLADVMSRDFTAFVADRLEEAPEHVRRALAIASTQGVSFSPRLVRRIAEGLLVVDADAGLREGEDPHSFLTGVGSNTDAEFRLRAYRMAARDDLGNLLDEVDVGDQLRAALTEVASDVSVAGNRDLALVLDAATLLEDDIEEWRYAAIRAGGELIERAQATFDGRTAWDLAERLLPLFNDEAALQYRDILYSVVDAAAQWTGPRAVFSEKLSAVIRRLRDPAEELEDTERRRELARAIGRLGNVVSVLDGPAAARPIHEEEEELCRALVKEQPTPDARRELGIALTHLGDLVEVLDGQAAVRPQREEIKRIFSALAEEQPTPEARRELALAVGRLGDVVEFLDGPTASKPLREEAQQIHRALAEEQPTPEARRDLAITVGRLGDVVEALDGPAAARSLREETENILRALAEEQPTPKARQDLAGAISQLGDLVEALDGLAAARSLHEEAENILRALAEEQPTLRTRSDLANALGNLGNVVEALDGPVAALPPLRESEGLHRALVDEQSTLETRRGLANTLGRLGSMLWAINGPDAARSYFEEVEKIYRKEVEEQPSSGALSSHANTLSWLARLLYDSGDLNAAQQVWEEGIQDALSAYRSDPSANTELRVLSDRSRLLQAQMLGPQPWQRPFAVEDLPMQSPRTLKELQSLMSSFRAWASKTDAITAAGWNEGMQIDFARCALAAGDARGALATLIASADAMRDALSTKPHDLAELATRHALTTGICAATAGEIDLGLDAFSRAAEINIPRQDRSPLALRYSAAIGWYHAALLREMGREAESASCFNSGHAAALSFARFEMMDGKAILHAFENFAA